MERLIVFAAGIAASAVVVLLTGRIRRARSTPSAPLSPLDRAATADPAACVRCAASGDAVHLIATPEGCMCERCYADAK
jgi:hypothetical protein